MKGNNMTTETNKAVVQRYIEEVINQGHLDAIDTLFSPEMRESVKSFATVANESFPDRYEEIRDLVAEGDTVMVHWIFHGTHQGLFYSIPPTGKQIEINGFGIYYLKNGQIVADGMCMDWIDAVEQLGGTISAPSVGSP
jgi:predicted ester cyclase